MDSQNLHTIQKIGEYLLQHPHTLSEKMEQHKPSKLHAAFNTNTNDVKDLLEELFITIGKGAVESFTNTDTLHASVEEWGKKTADYCIKNDVSISSALTIMPPYRDIFMDITEKQCNEDQRTIRDAFDIYSQFETFLDEAIYSFSHSFLHEHIIELNHAKTQMQEISVPVVPIKQETAVLPLIGDMDDERSEFLQRRTLERATELELSYLIIDLSGINTINTWFAQHLNQLIDALKLLGIDTSISGMRPELSQTIVQLGISFKHVTKYLTLEQALLQHSAYSI
ncbi:rsbT co-antagonist protein RsbR [Alteribacillus persepolensis]|uniref:RsbT co-antagonist protein RsbR n=1 Tax=Alteribacillus persepolensis TaxID=568899 RepID=A0A1G8FHN3_9BACI|nr:STAS domain-containing protein [Alteribacillus persepolensis]SDH81654.1 rsbT co-antagonist protein RsbR [Alteribacillus persepolensis]